MSQKNFGRITNYRIGIKSQQSKECLITFDNMEFTSTGKLVGKKVIWMNGKNKFIGKIVSLHGRKGTVRAKFMHPVPGQAIGTIVELIN